MNRSFYRNRPVDKLPLSSIKKVTWAQLRAERQPQSRFAFLTLPRLLWGGAGLAVVSLGIFYGLHAPAAEAPFRLEAQLDENGNPSFVLTSTQDDSTEVAFADSLVVNPPLDFEVAKLEDNRFEILLRDAPLFDTLYTFSIKDLGELSYQWTYELPSDEQVATVVTPDIAEAPVPTTSDITPSVDSNTQTPEETTPAEPSVQPQPVTPEVSPAPAVAPQESAVAVVTPDENAVPSEEETNSSVAPTPVSEDAATSPAPTVSTPSPTEAASSTVASPVETPIPEEEAVVVPPVPDVCVVDLKSFSTATPVNVPFKGVDPLGQFLLKAGAIFDASFLPGGQFLLFSGSKLIKGGPGSTYYLQKGVVENPGVGFTAYVKSGASFKAKGESGTLYYEEGATISNTGADTVMHECSEIQFLLPVLN